MGRLWVVGAVVLLSLPRAWAEAPAEVLEPDEQEPKKEEPKPAPSKTPEQENPPRVEKLPLVIDDPGFKAKAVFPEVPVPKFDQSTRPGEEAKAKRKEWSMPQEEGVDQPAAEGDTTEVQSDDKTREDISPALAKAIAKDKSGRKPKDVVEFYRQVVTDEPDNAAANYRLGVALVRNGQLAEGVALLEKALHLKPGNPKYQCDFGLAALRLGWLEKALAACQTAALALPAEPRFQSALGDCLLAARRLTDAVEAYARAVSLTKGKNADYVYNLGLVHLYAHAFKKAIEIFDEAISLRSDYPPYYCSRGLAYENSKNIKQAIMDYSKALSLDKNDAYAHFLLAGVYSDPDDPTYTNKFEAVAHAEKAVKVTQYKNAQYLMGLARALRVARNYDQAAAIAKKAVELDPRDEYKQELGKLEQMRMQGSQK